MPRTSTGRATKPSKTPTKNPAARRSARAANPGEAAAVFESLRRILKRHVRRLTVVRDEPLDFYLESRKPGSNGKPMFFGAAQTRKSYVSFHLMPVYTHPELLEEISPELRRRMQGKSCFNFTRPDRALFEELGELTRRGFELWDSEERV